MNQTELKNILSSNFDFEQWKFILDRMFSKIEYFTKEASIEASLIKSGGQVGTIRLDDGRSLAIFKFEVADNIIISRNRKGLRDIAAHYVDQSLIHGAWVFYYSKNQADYRLTYIAKQTFFNSNGELVKNETAPKRYTFLLGENEKCTTAASRLHELIEKKEKGTVYLADVTDAFSVERLNKEFFDGYFTQYKKFLGLRNKDNKDDRDYVKKLLGRLVFLQFLQKKGWMGVPANNKDWNDGDKNYLSNLVDKYEGNNRLLSDVLEPLFFETLNEPRENKELNPKLGDNIKIPYLNGGLFDKDRLDRLEIDFPYDYFKDLISFFSMYNFTIDENDPDDAEIGIDPEMLGHIFENLLEDNKDKGAFYTPKEIVQYMSRESITQYLKTHTEDSLHTAIELLVKNGKVADILQNKPIASNIYNLLKNIKVCDPAIGSGAFPMGILNVLYHCRQLLYGFTHDKNAFSPATIKREIIQDNIYGVDIEQGAVDIARLRFWLALVVDEVKPQPLPNLDYKVVCGNSLLSRFNLDMPFDDVFNEYNKGKNEEDKVSLSKYKQLVADYTNTSDHNKKDKFRKTIEEIKGAFRRELSNREIGKLSKLRGRIRDLEAPMLFGERTKAEKAEAKKLKTQLTKLEGDQADILNNKLYENAFEWRFEFPALLDDKGKFTGFDIVIGNPPYNELRDITQNEQDLLKKSKYYEFAKGGRLNIYQFFYPLAIDISMENGIISLITQNSILAESSAIGNRKLFFTNTDILSVDSFPERDNKNTRVFESAKMSVCICTLKKVYKADQNKNFPVTVWHSRFMTDNHILNIRKQDIENLYPEELIIPISSNEKFNLLRCLLDSKNYTIKSSAGEIDMTKYKDQFNNYNKGNRVITGAQVLRYRITDSPSQGEVIYLPDDILYNITSKRKSDISKERIVLQRITGVDSRIRIIATIIDDNSLCANSTNYIPKDNSIEIRYLLGVLNSTLINFFVKQTSTNTNITVKVLESLPIISPSKDIQLAIDKLVSYILVLRKEDPISNLVSNNFISNYFEKIIDGCVYELYFEEHMRERGINILDEVMSSIIQINNLTTEEKRVTIWSVFNNIKKTNNPIRTRLELFTTRSPEILKLIIEE